MASFNYGPMVREMREVFASGRTKDRSWRIDQLNAIKRMLTEQMDAFSTALNKDLKKDACDALTDEIGFCIAEAEWFIGNLTDLMRDKKKKVDMLNIGGQAYVHYEPLGVILDIGAWNYPIQIPVSTMINIIAAGNCVVIKPSEISAHTASALALYIPKYLDKDCVKVVEGAVPETTALLKERWDHIIYTGSGPVGKIVHKAAAEHLTPCTLELGGKCPGYVDASCDLEAVCNRISWAKYKNAGQTCISVDYVLVEESVEEAFFNQMIATVREQYGVDPSNSDCYGKVVSERHFDRLSELFESCTDKQVKLGGQTNRETLYFAPTIVTGISADDRLMKEEIFGPILPVLTVRGHKEAIDFINKGEKPLHVHVFSKKKAIIDEFIHKTSSGGFSANDAMIFRIERGLPFGGVGASGMGSYGGYSGFENFSHKKAVLVKSQGFEFLFKMMRYAPHTESKMKRLKFAQEFPKKMVRVFKGLAIIVPIAVVLGVVLYFGLNKGGSFAEPDL